MTRDQLIKQFEKDISDYLYKKLPVDTPYCVITDISSFIAFKTVKLMSDIHWEELKTRHDELTEGKV